MDDYDLLLANTELHSVSTIPVVRKFFTFTTFAINFSWGTSPWHFHLTNVFLHLITGVIVFLIINRLDKRIALFASLIFLIHPLQTESVSYVWQRAEIMAGLMYLLSYFLYLKGRMDKMYWLFALSFMFFTAGLMEKGTIITLPLTILLTERIFFKTRTSTWVLWGLFCSAVYTFLFRFDWFVTFFNRHSGMSFSTEQLVTQFFVTTQYIRMCFLPFGQNTEYHVFLAKPGEYHLYYKYLLVLLTVLWCGKMMIKRNPAGAFGIFLFFVYLIPTAIIAGREPMWERRVYVSLVGFGIFLVSVIPQKIRIASSILILMFFAVTTINRNYLWASPTALLEDAVKKSPMKVRPNNALGAMYLRQGRVSDAEKQFIRTLKIYPKYPESWNNLGIVYAKRGDYQKAEEMFKVAIEIGGLPIAQKNLEKLNTRGE
jgi:hypothetical protein